MFTFPIAQDHKCSSTINCLISDGQDAYLLCKILKKSGPGFKPGEQYGPFVEEEWEKDSSTLVPGEEGDDEALCNDDARVEVGSLSWILII